MAGPQTWALCLLWAASAADLPPTDEGPPLRAEVVLVGRTMTLAWTHSIEHVRWEESYALLAPTDTGQRCPPARDGALCPLWARVRGSGAGMEPAPDAVWRDGGYEWSPPPVALPALRLMHSAYTADYTLCLDGQCRVLREWATPVPSGASASDAAAVRLRPCRMTDDDPAARRVRPPPATKTPG
ncbi:MAG: DUF1850 domain-containing protein [Tepidimonas sp.]|uniref:DUF1850 domain-containing protein n=1 Tax=Tepidimonas sp. TaxID=2002775 RepID=UPI00259EB79F|nr:DUF1850 domain-containing protein [Tepidimonas sp.]MDM7456461.1 DUF1850 domain-containing protein [Tepidimonas sp.]